MVHDILWTFSEQEENIELPELGPGAVRVWFGLVSAFLFASWNLEKARI